MTHQLATHHHAPQQSFRYPGRRPAAADFLMLTTMYAPPRLPEPPLERERLLDRLAAGVRETPLTLVSGPAGSGKTTLAGSWITRPGVPWRVVWLTLSEATGSPEEFWFFVTEALGRAGVDLPHSSRVAGMSPAGEGFVIRLATDLLEREEPVVLVLDEVERLTDPAVPAQLELLMRLAGLSLRLVLLSRVDPLLPMQRYRMAGAVTEIRTADLAFTTKEAGELLLRCGVHLSRASLAALVNRTEGWAAGLQLAALTRSHLPSAERDAETDEWLIGVHDANLAEYLTREVLDAQPPHLRDFLLRTSVLELVSAELAEELTGEPGAAMALLTLVRGNILTEAVGDLSGCYRAHPLLRELLRAQLAYRSPELVPELHLRAARWFARAGMLVQAVSHYGAAGRWEEAAEMVVDGVLIVEALRPSTPALVQRLADMPEGTPGIPASVVRAAVALGRGADLPAGDDALHGVEQPPTGVLSPRLDVAVAATRLASASTRADPEETLARATRAADALSALAAEAAGSGPAFAAVPQEHADLLSLLLSAKGAAQLSMGELAAASLTLAAAVGSCTEAGFLPEQLVNLSRLALAEALQGHLHRAGELVDAATLLAQEQSVGAVVQLPPALVAAESWATIERDDVEAGRTALLHPMTPVEPEEQVVIDALLAVLWSRADRARGAYDAALASLTRPGPGPAWLQDLLVQERVAVHLAAGRAEEALSAAQATDEGRAEPRSPRASVVLGRAGLGLGDVGVATLLDPAAIERDDDTPLDVQVEAWLVKAQARLAAGDRGHAVSALRRGVRLARGESLRRPVRDAAPEVRRVLRTEASLAGAAAWLGRSPGPPTGTRLVPLPGGGEGKPGTIIVDPLSARETEVLRHLADLLTTEEVAATMFVSVNTVKSHIRSILRKLSVSRRNEAIRRARELQVI